MTVVTITGLPGSGKSTIAAALAAEMRLTLLPKDLIKESLADALPGVPESDYPRLGEAALQILLALVRLAPDVIVEGFFWPGRIEDELLALGRPIIQVHCTCPPETARARFERRLAAGDRHRAHHATDDWQRFTGTDARLLLTAPLVTVDTTRPVNVVDLAREVHHLMARARPVAGGRRP